MKSIKCVVVGDTAVGKSRLLASCATTGGCEGKAATPQDSGAADVTVQLESLTLGLWDTACQDDLDRSRPHRYQQANVVLVCFSLVHPPSFHRVRAKWYPEASCHCPRAPIILVGTMLDLREDPETLENLESRKQKPITEHQGRQMAEEINALKYLECSAVTRKGLKEVIDEVVNTVCPSKATKDKETKLKRSSSALRKIFKVRRSERNSEKRISQQEQASSERNTEEELYDEISVEATGCGGSTLQQEIQQATCKPTCSQVSSATPVHSVHNDAAPVQNRAKRAGSEITAREAASQTSSPVLPKQASDPSLDSRERSLSSSAIALGEGSLKLVAVGDEAVGKTFLILALAEQALPAAYVPTETDDCIKIQRKVDGQAISIGLWDTSGSEAFDWMRPENYHQTDVFLVCFSVVRLSSFDSVRTRWSPEVRRHCPGTPIILVGTQADEKITAVMSQQGQRLAQEINAALYIECSARTKIGLAAMLEAAIQAAHSCTEPSDEVISQQEITNAMHKSPDEHDPSPQQRTLAQLQQAEVATRPIPKPRTSKLASSSDMKSEVHDIASVASTPES